jgi:hypothetical protein
MGPILVVVPSEPRDLNSPPRIPAPCPLFNAPCLRAGCDSLPLSGPKHAYRNSQPELILGALQVTGDFKVGHFHANHATNDSRRVCGHVQFFLILAGVTHSPIRSPDRSNLSIFVGRRLGTLRQQAETTYPFGRFSPPIVRVPLLQAAVVPIRPPFSAIHGHGLVIRVRLALDHGNVPHMQQEQIMPKLQNY